MGYRKVIKDKFHRSSFLSFEKKKLFFRSVLYNETVIDELWNARYTALKKLWLVPASSSIVFIKNRCVFTYSARSVLSRFKVSRLEFRRLALNYGISGVRK